MQLTYRASQYTVASAEPELVETEVVGLYRGVPHKVTGSVREVAKYAGKLSYRGIQY